MYLRQSNKWNEYLLQEGVEDIGLPPAISFFLRQQNDAFGPVENKHLTWIGNLVKNARSDLLLPRENLMEIRRQLQQAVRTTLEKRGIEDKEVFGELWAEALAPLMEYRDEAAQTSPNITDIKKFKKRFMKNLRKLEIEPKFIKGFDSYVDNRMERGVAGAFMMFVKPIMLLLSEDPASYRDLATRDEGFVEDHHLLRVVGTNAQEILDNPPKAEDQVIHEFDNGYFWYDIRSHACGFEGKKMGHCGRGEHGQLYSLRVGEKRNVKPMVTVEFDGSTMYQIKGKANMAPKEDLWPYIDWFIENMGVDKIAEHGSHSSDVAGFDAMVDYLQEKHPDLDQASSWSTEATELLNQWEGSIEQDSETTLEINWPGGPDGVQEVDVVLRHQAFWPVKDIIVDEDTHRLRWEIKQDAQSIANDTLYPNPIIHSADVFARGVQDSQTAMIRIEMAWSQSFEPDDIDDEETVKPELEHLESFLEDLTNISDWLTSPNAAPEEAEFDYNEFHEAVQKRLEAYGVYRDIAGEIDAEKERERSDQMDLPLGQSAGEMDYDYGLSESRIIQRWSKIIK
jgi:hypothetical protein